MLNALSVQADKGNVILIHGKVKNQMTGESIGTNIIFVSEDGKKLSCRSNSSDGSYQQSLNSGGIYRIYLKNYIPVGGELLINIPPVSKYEEINQDIVVTNFKPDIKLMEEKVFEPNDSVIINKAFMKNLKYFLDLNPGAKLQIIVSSFDSWFNRTTKKIEKTNSRGKKYYKRISYSTKDQLSDLLDARINVLKNTFKENNIYLKNDVYHKNLRVVSEKTKRKRRKVPGKRNKYEYYIPEFPNVLVKITG